MPDTRTSPRSRSTKPRRVHVKPCIYRNTTEDGRVRYQFTYIDSAGKRRWQTVDGGLREAEAARDEMRVKLRRGERVADTRTRLVDLVEEWLAAQGHLRPSTQEGYSRALNTQILPRFGRVRVSQINEDDIIRLTREMEAAGYAAWTIRGTLAPLRRLLKHACRRGIITSNPFDRLERGERPRTSTAGTLRVLDRDEIEALLGAASPRYRVALATAIFTGLRRGELLGLRWCDVNLQSGEITVRYQLDRRSHQLVEPKTANARRTISLPRFLTQLLAEHRLASPYSADADYVFPTNQGTPMDARNFVRRSLASALKGAGLVTPGQTGVRFHDLRHTYASIMIAQGENVVYVSRQLGHSTPAITLGIYAHLIDQAEHARRATERLDQGYAHTIAPASAD
jgi:integrase